MMNEIKFFESLEVVEVRTPEDEIQDLIDIHESMEADYFQKIDEEMRREEKQLQRDIEVVEEIMDNVHY